MEKIIKFYPAFDKRNPDPKKNYGIGTVIILFVLKGKEGAVQFKMHTGWYLPGIEKIDKPQAWDLGYHSYSPMYDGQPVIQDNCEWLDDKPCYYDGSTLNAKPILDILIREGCESVWRELKNYYKSIFGKDR